MKIVLAHAALALLLGACAAFIGFGGRKGLLKAFKGRWLLLLPLMAAVAVLAVEAVLSARALVMPADPVTVLAFGMQNEAAEDSTVHVIGAGSGGLDVYGLALERSGGWQETDAAYGSEWRGGAEGAQDALTVYVPAGTRRWIRFESGPDRGQVLVRDGDYQAIFDSWAPEAGEALCYVPDSTPERLSSLRRQRLLVYAGILAVECALMALGIRKLRRNRIHALEEGKPVRRRNGAIDLYRGIFAIMIAAYHTTLIVNRMQYTAVDYFFLISGWMLMAHFEKSCARGQASPMEYLQNRVLRIFPYYCFRWLVGVSLCMASRVDGSLLQVIGRSFGDLMMMMCNGIAPRVNAIDDSAWYISAMVLASMGIYMLLCRNRRLFLTVLAPSVIVLTVSACYSVNNRLAATTGLAPGEFLSLGFWRGFAMMSLGCLLFVWTAAFRKKPHSAMFKAWASVWEAAMMVVLLWTEMTWRLSPIDKDAFPLLLVGLSITSVMSSGSYLTEMLSNPFSEWLGKLSMPVYLMHNVIKNVILAISPELTPGPLVGWTVVCTFAVAAVTLPLTEKAFELMGLGLKKAGQALGLENMGKEGCRP